MSNSFLLTMLAVLLIWMCCGLNSAQAANISVTESQAAVNSPTDDQLAEGAVILKQLQKANPQGTPAIPPILPKTAQNNTGQNNIGQNSTAASTQTAPPPAQPDSSLVQAKLPDLNSPVIDQANILTPDQKQAISQQILGIYQAGRAQIGLIILPSTGQEPIFNYAARAFTAWQLGDKKIDNGLLIVVAINDHKIQILTGYGLEGVLPDVVLKRIIEEQITPAFRQSNYAQGLSAGISKIDSILQLDPEIAKASADQLKQQQAAQARQQQQSQSALTILIILSVIGVVASAFFGRSLSASLAGAVGVGWGLTSGLGLIGSLLLGGGVFFLLISSIAQLILSGFFRGGGGFGGSRGGGFGGGGYRGGGGSFGGGGASGSW